MAARFTYPATRRDDTVIDTLHGVAVPDPYRFLEDPDSEETGKFVDAQNVISEGFLNAAPARDKIRKRLTDNFNYPKFGVPSKRGSRYYQYKNSGLQNQSVLYVQETLESPQEIFLDPNVLEQDGTASLGATAFSEHGRYFAYGVSRKGSDWQTIAVRDCNTKQDLTDSLRWVKFSSIAWTQDERGFFYCRYLEPASFKEAGAEKSQGTEVDNLSNQKVYYHVLGDDQAKDKLVYERPDQPEWMFGADVTDDGEYMMLTISPSCEPVNRVLYSRVAALMEHFSSNTAGIPRFTALIDNFDAQYDNLLNDGTLFYFKTNLNAQRYRVVTIDLNDPTNVREIIPQHEMDVLEYAICVHQTNLLCAYLHDVNMVIRVYNLSGQHLRDLPLPSPVGTIEGLSGRRKDNEMFYKWVSFLYPGSIIRYDFSTEAMSTFAEVVVPGFDPSLFEAHQVFYNSKDGTRVPMFIVRKKGLPMDGSNPTLLYGYGGFNISLTPSFSMFRVVMMTHFNAILAVPNIRGGGEYGEAWHKAGIKLNKQNVFDDFIAAGEYLVKENYTRPNRLAIMGGSNGGLLVAACANQRPDLFGVVIGQVGVMDMLRFHKFSIGYAWCSDYGCADTDEAEFKAQLAYSPVHTVRPGKPYPAILLLTGSHDDRVVPLHTFKLIATLQHVLGGDPNQVQPLMARIEKKAGHGGGKPISMIIEECTDILSFMQRVFELTWTE